MFAFHFSVKEEDGDTFEACTSLMVFEHASTSSASTIGNEMCYNLLCYVFYDII